MQKNTDTGNRPLAIAPVVFCAVMRVIQYLNFAPLGALSLFAGDLLPCRALSR